MGSIPATTPYPSAARLADSQCYSQYTASLKCKLTFSSFQFSFPSDL
ncbi:hypothetical protein SLEP1_g2787 [Rubroshorea leprosula]|uniref:Uncharacterized protein n=1 Tax=Rubroshorea leprosula TaxID=152421 RepID=A0AAV5HRK0_9ROSI|nr:hypothetical protein SLEP1_g2787 [Rubroshorea leprosula]